MYQIELVNDCIYEWNIQLFKVDPDSQLYADLQNFKLKEGKDHISLNFTFKVIEEKVLSTNIYDIKIRFLFK